MLSMKKVLFGCIIVMAVILIIGISWGNLCSVEFIIQLK